MSITKGLEKKSPEVTIVIGIHLLGTMSTCPKSIFMIIRYLCLLIRGRVVGVEGSAGSSRSPIPQQRRPALPGGSPRCRRARWDVWSLQRVLPQGLLQIECTRRRQWGILINETEIICKEKRRNSETPEPGPLVPLAVQESGQGTTLEEFVSNFIDNF